MSELLISVVIPTYNAENYIKECLYSLCQQTYSNLEIFVIDDGSCDSTVAICKRFADMDSRIRLITKENGGVSSARNRGIQEASGDYIIFCDADDFPESNLVEKYVSAIKEWSNKEIAFIMTGMFFDNMVNSHTKDSIKLLEANYGYITGEKYILSRSTASTLSWLRLFNFVTNKCYDLNIIKQHNIRYDEKVDIAEDLKFNLDYLDVTPGYIGMINEPLYHYIRRSKCGLSLNFHESGLDDTKTIYKRFIQWEKNQPNTLDDNVDVIEAIYLNDWTNRLTALHIARLRSKSSEEKKRYRAIVNGELRSADFQSLLKHTFKAKKISLLRYSCLRSRVFEVFFFFRVIYQFMKDKGLVTS